MRLLYFLFVAGLLYAPGTNAQQFINGEMEPLAGSLPCHYIPKNDFFQRMRDGGYDWSDTLKTNDPPTTYLVAGMGKDTCHEGSGAPLAGDFFLGMTGTVKGSNAISMKLNKPLILGYPYTLKLYVKKPRTGNAISLEVGYTSIEKTMGTSLGIISAPTDTAWTLVSYSFAPTTSDITYISIKAGLLPTGSDEDLRQTTYVDGLYVNDYTSVDNINGDRSKLQIYPNPMTDVATIALPYGVQRPCQLAIYDVAGRLIQEQKNVTDDKVTINRNSMAKGFYMVRVTGKDNNVANAKLTVE